MDKATDKLDSYLRVVMLDFSKAFAFINHHVLLKTPQMYGLPSHIVRCVATFLLDITQRIKIGNEYSNYGHPSGGVPQGAFSGPKCLIDLNVLKTTVPLYMYVDDIHYMKYATERMHMLCKSRLMLLLLMDRKESHVN